MERGLAMGDNGKRHSSSATYDGQQRRSLSTPDSITSSHDLNHAIPLSEMPYCIGTAMIGASFATMTIATMAPTQIYATGLCPSDAAGNLLPFSDDYVAVISAACACPLLEVLISISQDPEKRKFWNISKPYSSQESPRCSVPWSLAGLC